MGSWMIDRKKFFDAIRRSPFPGALQPGQVEGITLILNEWEKRRLTDLRHLAYMLATTKWETANTMQPIREYGRGEGKRYGVPVNGKVYYGRGFVQLTWEFNYKRMGELIGIDLINYPDRAMDPAIATKILFEGMIRGTFTGKKLADYFGSGVSDWTNARRIINGTDKAEQIADIARKFYSAMLAAKSDKSELPKPSEYQKPKARSWLDILLSIFRRS